MDNWVRRPLIIVALMTAGMIGMRAIEVSDRPRTRLAPGKPRPPWAKLRQPLIVTALFGGRGGSEFREVHQDGLLVGFEVASGRYGPGILVIRALRPIFRTPSGVKSGKFRGRPGSNPRRVTVVAKPGYAVGGVSVRTGDRLDALQVHFMQIEAGRLNPDKTYSSSWLGGRDGGRARRLAGDGKPVVGIVGRCGLEMDAIGLVQSTVPIPAEVEWKCPPWLRKENTDEQSNESP